MKIKFITAVSASVLSLCIASQSAIAGSVEKTYIYDGDDSARSICLAIAKNQPNRLKRALRHQRIGPTDRKVHTRFTCNGKDLLSYSEEMGAYEVAQMLAPKFDRDYGLAVANSQGK